MAQGFPDNRLLHAQKPEVAWQDDEDDGEASAQDLVVQARL